MSLTAPYKILLVVAFLLLDFAGFYTMDYQGKLAELARLHHELARSRAVLVSRQHEMVALQRTDRELDRLQDELYRLVASREATDPRRAAGLYVRKVQGLVADTDRTSPLVLESVSPLEDGEATTGVPAETFQINVQGDYGALGKLLVQLGRANSSHRVTINRIVIKSGDQPGDLEVSIPMTAYMEQTRR